MTPNVYVKTCLQYIKNVKKKIQVPLPFVKKYLKCV